MGTATNPFKNDPDRAAIWEMLVARDIRAFVHVDWAAVENDFVEEHFIGIDAKKHPNPDQWHLAFPTLEHYRDEWLRQAKESAKIAFAEPLEAAILRVTDLSQIEINGHRALAHKKFHGKIAKADGDFDCLDWQSLYFCLKQPRGWKRGWKISGFVGYMPRS